MHSRTLCNPWLHNDNRASLTATQDTSADSNIAYLIPFLIVIIILVLLILLNCNLSLFLIVLVILLISRCALTSACWL